MAAPFNVQYASRRDAFGNCRTENGAVDLFVPTSATYALGMELALIISFADTPERFYLTGRVVFRRAAGRTVAQLSGIGLRFFGDQKKAADELVEFCSTRVDPAGRIIAPRYRILMPCVVHTGKSLRAQVFDLSRSGTFVTVPSGAPPAKDDSVLLRLNPLIGSLGGKTLDAQVVWVGEKQGSNGFGARFTSDAARVHAVVDALIAAKAR